MRVHHSVSHREANHEVAGEQGDRIQQQGQQQFKRIQAHTVTLYARREAARETRLRVAGRFGLVTALGRDLAVLAR